MWLLGCTRFRAHAATPPLTHTRLPQITVDGDTSTNDTVVGLASGKSGAPHIGDASSADGKALEAALTALLQARMHLHLFVALRAICHSQEHTLLFALLYDSCHHCPAL